MSNSKPAKHKHLTLDDRQEIQLCLNRGMSFKDIARRVGKDPTTISKEVKKHLSAKPSPVKRTTIDGEPADAKPCPKLIKAPFVCNPCGKKQHRCAFAKQFYVGKAAHAEYESLLSEAREGVPLNREEFYAFDAAIAARIKKGQRLYHILQTQNFGAGCSKSTVYRHLNKGYLSVSKTDFPRVVKFKARKKRRVDSVPKAVKDGRTYDDFIAYKDERAVSHWVEMDTVIGKAGGRTIMTFDFTLCNFMFGLLLNDKTAAEAASAIIALKKKMSAGQIRFGDVFPLILTDNGGEFANVKAFTEDEDGAAETDMFFCDPYQSSQKPKVEKNHTLFRDIVPKGESFDHFTQKTVDMIFSHVNGVKRKILNGKSPYETFAFVYGEKTAGLFGIIPIPADDVIQSPKLLKRLTDTFAPAKPR